MVDPLHVASYSRLISIQAEVSPLYVKGKKKYGRKSKPFTTEDFAELSQFDSLDIDKIETDVEDGITPDQSHSLQAINSESMNLAWLFKIYHTPYLLNYRKLCDRKKL
ncbi:hypothetical protein KUTeg_013769 [Tegillarca granosa]|uniref:Uncharacterized protein n=1 Tax=Tegillarca granosa TaxID=220873 RepID=A0ABQ9EZS6_TEGGR|nr:hypothetical protein KUTeg_013769 [Tegillarca granosa]